MYLQVEESKRMMEESKKMATTLIFAQATQETYERESAQWMKEKEEYIVNIIRIQKMVLGLFMLKHFMGCFNVNIMGCFYVNIMSSCIYWFLL